jgi:hypothetical protein
MKCSRSSRTTAISNSSFPAPSMPSTLRGLLPPFLMGQPVYAYIVTTVKSVAGYGLIQTGCAPNFEGGRITLCACKHKDRATMLLSKSRVDPWEHVWVAAFTSKSANPSRSLVYLMLVERSFDNQVQLWNALSATGRLAKNVRTSSIGDLYKPKSGAARAPHVPSSYHGPVVGKHAHSTKSHPMAWHTDIQEWGRKSIPHRLLLGDKRRSYYWKRTRIIMRLGAMGSSAHHKQYDSLDVFLNDLESFDE